MTSFQEILEDISLNEAFTANHQSIIDLVKDKRIVTFYYMGDEEEKPGWRTGEPVCYGKGYVDSHSGKKLNDDDYIRLWQDKGPSVSAGKTGKANRPMPGWRFFKVNRIRNWNLSSNKNFTVPPSPNFNANGDKNISTIYAIADFTPGKTDEPEDLAQPSGPQKPLAGKLPADKQKKEPTPGAPSISTNEPPDEEPDDKDNEPDKKEPVHYASTRTPKPIVKVGANKKPRIAVRNGKPRFRMRENSTSFLDMLKEIFKIY